jgi:bacterioferritin-associated ferredoxin
VYVCLCIPVSDRKVRSTIDEGARTLEELGERCGAGTICGGCLDELRAQLEEAKVIPADVGRRRDG